MDDSKIQLNEIKERKTLIFKNYNINYLTFNFSFIAKKYGIEGMQNKSEFSSLIKKIRTLSQKDIVQLTSAPFDKKNELEPLPENTKMRLTLDKEFKNERLDDCTDKYWVFRFNGQNSRIIGKLNGSVYYVLAIDMHLKIYDHGS